MTKRTLTIIAYDISDDKKRTKVSKMLERYGQRVNYSVFECMLTERQYGNVKGKLAPLINEKEDCILFYRICKACFVRAEQMGKDYTAGQSQKVVISVK